VPSAYFCLFVCLFVCLITTTIVFVCIDYYLASLMATEGTLVIPGSDSDVQVSWCTGDRTLSTFMATEGTFAITRSNSDALQFLRVTLTRTLLEEKSMRMLRYLIITAYLIEHVIKLYIIYCYKHAENQTNIHA
jgi:hypothetical protein